MCLFQIFYAVPVRVPVLVRVVARVEQQVQVHVARQHQHGEDEDEDEAAQICTLKFAVRDPVHNVAEVADFAKRKALFLMQKLIVFKWLCGSPLFI